MFRKYLFFICGQLGLFTLVRFFYTYHPKYVTELVAGAPLVAVAWFSVVQFGFRIFDGVTDPLAGALSDRWVRSGRRRQFLLLFAFLLVPVGLWICFVGDHGMAEGLRKNLLMIGLFVFYIGYTFYAIPYWSLVDDYSEKDEARRRVYSNLLGGGIMTATAIVAVAVPMLLNDYDYAQKALILGSVCSVLMILPLFAAPKSQKKPVIRYSSEAQMSLFKGFGVAFRHRRFLALIALFSGSQMSFTVMTGAGLFITIDLLKGTESQMAFVLGPLILFAIPSFLFVPKISRKLGWEKGMLFASIGAAVVYGLSGFLGQSIVVSPIITAGVLFAIGGPMVAILLGLEGEAVVDCATEHGGTELVGVYWGVFNFIVKVLNAIALNILFYWAGKMESMGDFAVRCMSFSAGGLLVVGVVAYLLIRRK